MALKAVSVIMILIMFSFMMDIHVNGQNNAINRCEDGQGPHFIQQPSDVVFDLRKSNHINMTCNASGSPNPEYEWFKEHYDNEGQLTYSLMDPLKNKRLLISGGSLIINDPIKIEDTGIYHCKASNKFGAIISNSIELSFSFIGEFNPRRSDEIGDMNRGFVLSCEPPQYFPNVQYFWLRETFPNFIDQNERIFVSSDGSLFFSSLEKEDSAHYSCNVRNKFSNTGKNGPFFQLHVKFHSGYDKIRFPANFPKIFPKTPFVGREVRLECFVYSWHTPSYVWEKINSSLPKSAYLTNHNRVLVIPNVQMEDEGEYKCSVNNGIDNKEEKTILLVLQAEPVFRSELTLTIKQKQAVFHCDAFGNPNVSFKWLKNGNQLVQKNSENRLYINENQMIITGLDKNDDGVYQCAAENIYKKKLQSIELRVMPKEIKNCHYQGGKNGTTKG